MEKGREVLLRPCVGGFFCRIGLWLRLNSKKNCTEKEIVLGILINFSRNLDSLQKVSDLSFSWKKLSKKCGEKVVA